MGTLNTDRRAKVAMLMAGVLAALVGHLQADDVVSLQNLPRDARGTAILEVNCGEVPEGISVQHDITVKNDGKTMARLNLAATDCGCTTGTRSVVLKQDQVAPVAVYLNTAGRKGNMKHRLVYRCSGLGKTELLSVKVTANVVGEVKPDWDTDFGALRPGQWRSASVSFVPPKGSELVKASITGLKSKPVKVQIAGKNRDLYQITCPVQASTTGGEFKGVMLVELKKGNRRWFLSRRVRGEVTNPWLDVSEVHLGVVYTSEEQKTASREFPLKRRLLKLDKIKKPNNVTLSFAEKEGRQHLNLSYSLLPDESVGRKTFYLEIWAPEDRGGQKHEIVYKIPVRVIVLP